MKHLILPLILIFAVQTPSYSISDKIQRVYNLPIQADKCAECGEWAVYKYDTEETELYTACKLYLQNRNNNTYYFLLETKGEHQKGTPISILSRYKLAYGKDDVGTKPEASYEIGYIRAVDEVFVLSDDKILISGVPDSRNYYNYVIDLNEFTATHIGAFSKYIQTVKYNNFKFLEFESYTYTDDGLEFTKEWYTVNGELFKNLGIIKESPDNIYLITFYIWGIGDNTRYGKSKTGHSFVSIPQIGCVGYSGTISDHSNSIYYATDSCAFYITGDKLYRVQNKFREWQQFTPDYIIGRCDCTSFALDIADAAGINYGNRLTIQFPSTFMKRLKQTPGAIY